MTDRCRTCARAHDDAVWRTLTALLGADPAAASPARHLAFLPSRLGGLGLFSAGRTKEAAYWAAWPDALPVIAQRRPAMADHCITQMTLGNHSSRACFRAAAAAGAFFRAHGWKAYPSWEAFRTPSASHPRLDAGEPSLALHGWQHAATLATSTSYRERVVLPSLTAAGQA